MSRFLLDTNVLIALLDPMHTNNSRANAWFDAIGHKAWATCPITQNGVLRILGSPNYPNHPENFQVVLEMLRQLCALPGHEFWADDISLCDAKALERNKVMRSADVTDCYLLALAVRRNGKLASYDKHLASNFVFGGIGAFHLLH